MPSPLKSFAIWRLTAYGTSVSGVAKWLFGSSSSRDRYIFLWIVTGDYRTLTAQELLLLGLSSATGLGAFLITDESDTATPRGSAVLTKEELSLEDPDKLQALALSEREIQKTGGSD